jgi:hypothetical protein
MGRGQPGPSRGSRVGQNWHFRTYSIIFLNVKGWSLARSVTFSQSFLIAKVEWAGLFLPQGKPRLSDNRLRKHWNGGLMSELN